MYNLHNIFNKCLISPHNKLLFSSAPGSRRHAADQLRKIPLTQLKDLGAQINTFISGISDTPVNILKSKTKTKTSKITKPKV